MDIREAIRSRRSIRAFTKQPVPRHILEDIIETARWAGSFVNSQPWEFAILGGELMAEWKKCLVQQYKEGHEEGEREVYPDVILPEPYILRAEKFRANIDGLMFPPEDLDVKQKREDYTISGIQVRDAPNAIIVLTEKQFIKSTLLMISLGLVIQNICLTALAHELGTCVMGRPVERPQLIRNMLNIPDSKAIPCVIAIGYPDWSAQINHIKRERAPLESITTWWGFHSE